LRTVAVGDDELMFRGDEVTADVIDGPQSMVFPQAANRLYTEQAVLAALVDHRLTGRGTEAEEVAYA
jgi:hypothetical protein